MLLYFAGPQYYKIAFWSEQSADWYDWQGAQGVSASLTAYGDRPTHWMLLPEPPAGLDQPTLSPERAKLVQKMTPPNRNVVNRRSSSRCRAASELPDLLNREGLIADRQPSVSRLKQEVEVRLVVSGDVFIRRPYLLRRLALG